MFLEKSIIRFEAPRAADLPRVFFDAGTVTDF